jgi:hypothetical protein
VSAATRRALHRLGGTALTVGLWAGIAFLAGYLAWPGQGVDLVLHAPPIDRILPLGEPVEIAGVVSANGQRLRCGGETVRVATDGRFRATLLPPAQPGLHVIDCRVDNEKDRVFQYRYGRLAGASRPLAEVIDDALVVALPLPALTAPGGLLDPLNHLLATVVAPRLIEAGQKLHLVRESFTLGPIHLSGVTLVGVTARRPDELAVTVGLHDVSVWLSVSPGGLVDRLPEVVRQLLPALGPRATQVKLGPELRLTFTVRWPPGGGRPTVGVAGITTEHLKKALRIGALASLAAHWLAPLSRSLEQGVVKAFSGAAQLDQKLTEVFREIKLRLARLGALLPPLPGQVAPGRPAACIAFDLSHLSSEKDVVRFHLSAQVRGYTTGGAACFTSGPPRPVPGAPRRLLLGPPDPLDQVTGPSVVVSHDLLNAYVATLHAAGTLARLPVSVPALAQHGFDVRSLRYGLPPVITTRPGGRLQLEVPELGLDLATTGEPRRLLTASFRLPLALAVPRPGVAQLSVSKSAPPEIFVRCEAEAGRGACSHQSRRFQGLVEAATSIAFAAELAQPPLTVQAMLPTLRAQGVTVEVADLKVLSRGVLVELTVR